MLSTTFQQTVPFILLNIEYLITTHLLYTPGDYQDLANKMVQSLSDPQRSEKAKIAAQKTRQDYSFEGRFSMLKEIMDKY